MQMGRRAAVTQTVGIIIIIIIISSSSSSSSGV
jgi:hypothetical protein